MAIDDYSSDGVARAVLAALDRLDELSRRAARAADGAPDSLSAMLTATVDSIRAERSPVPGGRLRRFLLRTATSASRVPRRW